MGSEAKLTGTDPRFLASGADQTIYASRNGIPIDDPERPLSSNAFML
jgi:hypothetical protein